MTIRYIEWLCSDCGGCDEAFPGLRERCADGPTVIDQMDTAAACNALQSCKTEALQIDDREIWPCG